MEVVGTYKKKSKWTKRSYNHETRRWEYEARKFTRPVFQIIFSVRYARWHGHMICDVEGMDRTIQISAYDFSQILRHKQGATIGHNLFRCDLVPEMRCDSLFFRPVEPHEWYLVGPDNEYDGPTLREFVAGRW